MTLSTPDWLADAVFYQIFPERFANGDPSLDPPGTQPWGGVPTRDNFFGGDLAGIIQHLDHIVSVGANAIYLTPIFAADTNHRYDTKDYFAIDRALGDLDTFHELIAAAHARGIRVVLDAVLNHSGDGHWAFADVVAREADSPYVNWYSVEGFPVRSHPTPNYRTCSGCYYLPKWNAYNPEVREHHYRVARHWVEQGIDGWRLDVPYFINHDFWRGFRRVVKGIDEDLYIVAEEWRSPEQWLQGDLADGTMNYGLRDLVLGFTADRTLTAADYADGMRALAERVPAGARPAMLNLLGSHDTERVLTRHAGSVPDALLAYTLLVTAQGAPMLYYGDEVGLQGDNDPGCRGTMPWDSAEWSQELLQGIRSLTALRAAQVAARRGEQLVAAWGDDVVAVLRDAGEQGMLLTLVNRGDDAVEVPDAALDGSLFGRPLRVGWRAVLGDEAVARDAAAPLHGSRPCSSHTVIRRVRGAVKSRRVTMQQVADAAKVSKTAVSFAFNDSAHLSETTLRHILTVAEDLGYSQDPAARMLRTRRTNSLGLLLPQQLDKVLENPHYTQFLQGIGQVCQREGFTLLLAPPLRGSMLKTIPYAAVDGFIVSGLEYDRGEVRALRQRGIPFVLVDSEHHDDVPSVEIDDGESMRHVVEHLLGLGHRRIAVLAMETGIPGGYTRWHGPVRRRMEGIIEGLAQAGLTPQSDGIAVIEVPCTRAGGVRAFRDLWSSADRPTAVIAFSDIIALGVLDAARELGVSVPGEVSVTGFDDLAEARWSSPQLTTVRQPIESKGRLAAEYLVESISADDSARPQRQQLHTALLVRGSTAEASA